MASPGSDTPRTSPAAPIRKPLAILHISKKEEEDRRLKEAAEQAAVEAKAQAAASKVQPKPSFEGRSTSNDMEGLTMADLLGAAEKKREPQAVSSSRRQVDDFDFDEEAFLAALDENEPIGATGDVVTGTVIAHESDGIYVVVLLLDATKGIEVQVLVTREQNADGMVTISCRALALRQAWEKVRQLEKDGKVVQVKLTGFNRGGCTCDLEGLRGFIPRSQLEDGENHEALVGKTIGVAFLEVNPETRKLVLSEKKASTSAKFANLEVGQLVSGQVVSLKPYGFFVDLGGVSGLLHQSSITGGALRDLREAFETGETIQALIMELDPGRGRIGLNTALLENQPGELLVDKAKVMKEAEDRANRARNMIRQKEQSAG